MVVGYRLKVSPSLCVQEGFVVGELHWLLVIDSGQCLCGCSGGFCCWWVSLVVGYRFRSVSLCVYRRVLLLVGLNGGWI